MTDLSTAAATKAVEKTAAPTIRDLVQKQQAEIEVQLAGALNSGAFVRAAISEISKSVPLQQATSQSVLGSIMLAAQLKLEIGPALGHFYLTPRSNSYKDGNEWKKRWECVPIVGYQGLIELAYRSGRIGKIETFLIRDGDKFDYGANSERGRFFDWSPADYDETRPWTGAVVTAQIVGSGSTVWAYMPREKILARRPVGWEKGPWKTNEEEMARKTLVREIAPYLPKSTEFGQAVAVTRDVEENGAKVEHIAGVHDLVVVNEAFTGDPSQMTAEELAEQEHGTGE
jgi:recombination protein RecT